MPQQLASAKRHTRLSTVIAQRAVRESRRVASQGTKAVATVVAAHQAAQAVRSQAAVVEMLAEQAIEQAAEALLNSLAFTTSVDTFVQMVEASTQAIVADLDTSQFDAALAARTDRLVQSLIQDAGRAAEGVAVTVRQDVYWTRFVNPPCCSRCALLAGRRYRWSDGFERHPGCDCSMVATGEQSPYVLSPSELIETGQVRGLSKADIQALADGADLGRLVNIRSKKAGLTEAGQVLGRGSRLTPAGIYKIADGDRTKALDLLAANGYIH